MSEILPPDPSRRVPDDRTTPAADQPEPEVGFERNSAQTALLLSRYLVGRAIAAKLSISLLVIALLLLGGAVALWLWVSHGLAVFVLILAIVVLLARAIVMAILHTLMGVGKLGPAEAKVRELVKDTRGDLRRELRRIGLPGSTLGLPLLIFRLIGHRRARTLVKLTRFNITNVVPRSRMNELYFIVRSGARGRSAGR